MFTHSGWPQTFSKVLIANRGEIACRVIDTAKYLGIKTVAVYSDADRDSKHVRLADEAYHIGPSPSQESYLRSDYILKIARLIGVEAIHPGYGFLSENAAFSEACSSHGIEFIGPPASAILQMGSKAASKLIMTAAGVPVVPGYHGDTQTDDLLYEKALEIGFPVMLKAVSGGGGKGMRVVKGSDRKRFQEALDGCRREAKAHFNDDRMLVEKYIQKPRHVEFQIFGDKHGNAIHFCERDCSVQRRHQKVLEEAPSPGMTEQMRSEMGKSATDAAKAVGYVGAGTVEFIVDAETNQYYFMEMNTRLQVEHPVTEMITQKDLVQLQFHVAKGFPIPFTQESISITGHAIEARVYAEDPNNMFLPGSGTLSYLDMPSGAGVRIDSGVRQGDIVSVFYDPMIAKLIVHDSTREGALNRMHRALKDFKLIGLPNNVRFLQNAVSHPKFIEGGVDTGFIAQHESDLLDLSIKAPPFIVPLAACSLLLREEQSAQMSLWHENSSFRVNMGNLRRLLFHDDDGVEIEVVVDVIDERQWYITDTKTKYSYHVTGSIEPENEIRAIIDDQSYVRTVVNEKNSIHVFDNGMVHTLTVPRQITWEADTTSSKRSDVCAPMPGKVVKVLVRTGDKVKIGDSMVVMEAMKMEHIIAATTDGVVDQIFFNEGEFVAGDSLLVSFQEK